MRHAPGASGSARQTSWRLDPWADEGVVDDGVAFYSPWGLNIDEIKVPVKVWHGGDDHFVPLAHGRLVANTIPGAQTELRDDDGHVTVVAERIGDVHEWLAQYL